MSGGKVSLERFECPKQTGAAQSDLGLPASRQDEEFQCREATVFTERAAPDANVEPASRGSAETGTEIQGDPSATSGPAPADADVAHLVATLDGVVDELRSAEARRLSALRDAFAGALAKSLPGLAETAFPAEVAGATASLARREAEHGLVLRLSAEDCRRIAVGSATPEVGAIEIREDDTLAPGQAEFDWTDGGAVLTAEAIAERTVGLALAALDRAETDEP